MIGPDAKWRHSALQNNSFENRLVEEMWGNRNGMRSSN